MMEPGGVGRLWSWIAGFAISNDWKWF